MLFHSKDRTEYIKSGRHLCDETLLESFTKNIEKHAEGQRLFCKEARASDRTHNASFTNRSKYDTKENANH
jgi:hypothetical protein